MIVMLYWPAGVLVVCVVLEELDPPPHPEMPCRVKNNSKNNALMRSERALRLRVKTVGKKRNANRVRNPVRVQT